MPDNPTSGAQPQFAPEYVELRRKWARRALFFGFALASILAIARLSLGPHPVLFMDPGIRYDLGILGMIAVFGGVYYGGMLLVLSLVFRQPFSKEDREEDQSEPI